MRLSAIIAVKDRPRELARAVKSLLNQTLPPDEIVIVDQSSSDECRRAASEIYSKAGPASPKLIYVHDPCIDGLTEARNEGLRRIGGEYVLFIDDDSVLAPDTARLMVEALRTRADLLAVGGVITNYTPPAAWVIWFRRLFLLGHFWDERQPVYWNWARYAVGQVIPVRKLNGGCMAFRRDALLQVGGFDPRYTGSSVAEDIEISERLIRNLGRPAGLALVGGAHMTHKSLGDWKRADRRLGYEIVALHYVYCNRAGQNLANMFRFRWWVFGVSLWACAAALRHWDRTPVRSVRWAMKCVRSGYAGCPFLKAPTG